MSLGGLLGSLVGARGGSMVGRMLFGRTGGMVGGLLGSMLGGGGSRGLRGMMGGVGDLFGGKDDDEVQQKASALPDDEAAILIRAMCNSAKADGRVDESEIEAIVGQLGQLDADDEAFLRNELQSPLDLDAFISEVPSAMADQVYAVSLLSIDIDSINEEHYLATLAEGLGVDKQRANEVHDELNIPRIF